MNEITEVLVLTGDGSHTWIPMPCAKTMRALEGESEGGQGSGEGSAV